MRSISVEPEFFRWALSYIYLEHQEVGEAETEENRVQVKILLQRIFGNQCDFLNLRLQDRPIHLQERDKTYNENGELISFILKLDIRVRPACKLDYKECVNNYYKALRLQGVIFHGTMRIVKSGNDPPAGPPRLTRPSSVSPRFIGNVKP